MDIFNPFKAEKLKIVAVNEKGKEINADVFEAMFNPSSYSVSLQNEWQEIVPGISSFVGQKSDYFTINLVLDGTGASEFGLTTGFGLMVKTVKERIDEFMKVCYNIIEDLHMPNIVKLTWGDFNFIGKLESVTINYTLFNASGNPLRAELNNITFKAINDQPLLSSPDLTHTREVHEGDTLPLLSKEIYGSSKYYLFIAEANKLDDFRNLKAGTKLYFPPLENQI